MGVTSQDKKIKCEFRGPAARNLEKSKKRKCEKKVAAMLGFDLTATRAVCWQCICPRNLCALCSSLADMWVLSSDSDGGDQSRQSPGAGSSGPNIGGHWQLSSSDDDVPARRGRGRPRRPLLQHPPSASEEDVFPQAWVVVICSDKQCCALQYLPHRS